MNDYAKMTNQELLEAYKIISDYVKELENDINKVDNDD